MATLDSALLYTLKNECRWSDDPASPHCIHGASDSKAFLSHVLKSGGGWSDNPNDAGGATNCGITLKTAMRHGVKDKAALKSITPETVIAIYDADYWRFAMIDNQRVATLVFDHVVHRGLNSAVKLLQCVLAMRGESLAIDGVWGPKTLAAVNAMRGDDLLIPFAFARAGEYCVLATSRKENAEFLAGWLRRAKKVPL
jgi:type VI secretion system secreted protein VgrG